MEEEEEETALLNKQLHEQSHLISQTIFAGEENGRMETFIHTYTYTYIYTNFPLIHVS